MSFFAIFEIIKTADLLEDAAMKGLDSLMDNMPTKEDVKGMVDSVRSTVEKLTLVVTLQPQFPLPSQPKRAETKIRAVQISLVATTPCVPFP